MPPHRNKQFKSTFMWLLKIPLILQLLCYSNTLVIQHRPLNWSACWKMSAQANKIPTYVQYTTCGQNKKSVFRHKDTDYSSITVIDWKASWDFYVRILQTQASTTIFVKSCETINDTLRHLRRIAFTLIWQYSNHVPQYSHTYPPTHLQLTESSTFLLLPEIETVPKGTGFPRRQGTAAPCSLAFASTARYGLRVLQTKVDPPQVFPACFMILSPFRKTRAGVLSQQKYGNPLLKFTGQRFHKPLTKSLPLLYRPSYY